MPLVLVLQTKSAIGTSHRTVLRHLGMDRLHTLRSLPMTQATLGAVRKVRNLVAWTIIPQAPEGITAKMHLCPPRRGYDNRVARRGYLQPAIFKQSLLRRYRVKA